MQEAVRDKKAFFKKWQRSNSPSDKGLYLGAKSRVKKMVAKAELLSWLRSMVSWILWRGKLRLVYKLAKSRSRAAQDMAKCVAVKGQDGVLLTSAKCIKDCWCSHFKELSNETNNFVPPPQIPANLGIVPPITPDEVERSLARMKNGKAVGHDGVPIEVWKAVGTRGVLLLTELFNKIIATGLIPDAWRVNIITPIYKGKGSV